MIFTKIKNRIPIRNLLEVLGVKITRGGMALCPFHGPERTPSLKIYEDENRFHCFGCSTGGDAFDFVQKLYNVSRGEALKILAEKAGIPLDGTRPDPVVSAEIREQRKLKDRREKFFQIYEARLQNLCDQYLYLNRITRQPLPAGFTEERWLGVLAPFYDELTRVEAGLSVLDDTENLADIFSYLFPEKETLNEAQSRRIEFA